MIILHAGLCEDHLALWAEASPQPDSKVKKTGERGKTVSARRDYPFATSPHETMRAVSSVFEQSGPLKKKDFTDYALWAPTVGRTPVASSPLIQEPPEQGGETSIKAWRLRARSLEPLQAIQFLCAAADKRILEAGVVVGSDVTFWVEALRFAGSLAIRGQFLPSLHREGHSWRARWAPIIVGKDVERFHALADKMPGAARALTPFDGRRAPSMPAAKVLDSFLGLTLDCLARSRSSTGKSLNVGPSARDFPAVHDAWLHALTAPDATIRWAKPELRDLEVRVNEWRRPVDIIAGSQLRLCFRLEEPGTDEEDVASRRAEDSWYVRYILQRTNDLSFQVPVEDVWAPEVAQSAGLNGGAAKAREFLLAALGQAAALCSNVAESLSGAHPSGYELDTAGAYEFLTSRAPLLEQVGFGVMVPGWWTQKGGKARIAVTARVKSPKLKAKSVLSLHDVVKVDWEMALGGEKLTQEELDNLAKIKAPLVRFRGQWVEAGLDEIRRAVKMWKKVSGKTTVKDVVHLALGASRIQEGLEFGGVGADGWVGDLLGKLDGTTPFKKLAPPKGFSGALRPYQIKGYSWLDFLTQWGLGACLADDMGLGKTIQTLALIQNRWEANDKRPTLLVCPTTVVSNWKKEAERFTPNLPVMVHHGVTRRKEAAFQEEAERHALVISSYGLLHRDIEFLSALQWSGVVLDEAQNIKNPETKQAKAARSIPADFRIALTGTPVENTVGDLWSIMEFLNAGLLGGQTEFRRRFLVPIQAERSEEAVESLKRLTGPFILRRLKTDKSIISDLPEKMEMKVYCSLTKEQASLYAAVVKETERVLAGAEGMGRRGLILATLSKLKQVCNHPAQFLGDNSAAAGRSGKLNRLSEMLSELIEVGDRALVFTQFSEMGKLLQRHLQDTFGAEVLFLHGATPKAKRDRMVDRFQTDDGPNVFILSLKAGGTGLNLTAANHVFHFDRWWNPAVENQATDRAFRIGQTRRVQVHKFLCAGTLEEKIDEIIEGKKDIAEKTIGAGEGWLTELSNRELKNIWKLRKEEVGD